MTSWTNRRYRLLLLLAGLALAAGLVLAKRSGALAVSDMERMRARGAVFVRNEFGEVLEAHLDGPKFHDIDLLRLTAFPTLESLSLKNSRVTDAGIGMLEVLQRLQRLDLSGTSISVAGLERIAKCSKIWELDLRGCPRLSTQDLLVLSSSKNLSSLFFDWRKMRDAEYEILFEAFGSNVPSPQELFNDLPGGLNNRFPSIGVDLDRASHYFSVGREYWKSNLPDIPYAHRFTHAAVDGTIEQDNGFRLSPRLAQRMQLVTHLFPGIEQMHLVPAADADLKHLKDLPRLTELTVSTYKRCTVEGLRALQGIPRLSSLTMNGVEFRDDDRGRFYFRNAVAGQNEDVLSVLAGIKGLQTLEVKLSWSGKPAARWLGDVVPSACVELKLEVESASGAFHDGDDTVLEVLPVLFPNIRKLTFSFAGHMDLAPLTKLQYLEVLRVTCARTPSIAGLSGHPTLRLLEIYSAHIDLKRQSQVFAPIARWSATDLEALGTCPQLNVIQLPADFVPDMPLSELERILQMKYAYPGTDPFAGDFDYIEFHRGEVDEHLYD